MTPVHPVLSLWTGVLSVQAPAAQDSVARIQDSLTGRFVDSVVVLSPLPDPLVPIVQWIFQRPSWVMISGLILAVLVVFALLLLLWRRRRAIRTWLVTRKSWVKAALAGTIAVLLILFVGSGVKAHDYVMHDNDFCKGCHVFVPSGQLFVRPDTGRS